MTSVSSPSQQQAYVHTSHPFTCNTCQVAFRSSELQRAHMQTDWHRYNLKRRVASLPPLSSEIFTEKVLANKASAAATAAKATFEKHCGSCQKTYYSENAFTDHLRSQRHKANALKRPPEAPGKQEDEVRSVTSSAFSLGDPLESSQVTTSNEPGSSGLDAIVENLEQSSLADTSQSGTATPAASVANGQPDLPTEPPLNCLFCNYASPKFHLNLNHMEKHHGMFIPERDYLVDLDGLILHLQRKISEAHMCLYCGAIKHTAAGAQTHMLDKGHCMIGFDSEDELIEIGQFYDFRSTYSDGDDYATTDDEDEDEAAEARPSAASKLGARRAVTSNTGEDDGWETDSSFSSVPSEEITSIPIADFSHRYATLSQHRHHNHADPRPHHNRDGVHSHAHHTPHAVYHDDHELHLPSGRSVGHRSLRVYWNQNLRRYPGAVERAAREGRLIAEGGEAEADGSEAQDQEGDRERGRQIVSRANGGLGMVGVTDAKKKEVSRAEKRERAKQGREKERQRWGNERRNNFQKHYRDPLLQ